MLWKENVYLCLCIPWDAHSSGKQRDLQERAGMWPGQPSPRLLVGGSFFALSSPLGSESFPWGLGRAGAQGAPWGFLTCQPGCMSLRRRLHHRALVLMRSPVAVLCVAEGFQVVVNE